MLEETQSDIGFENDDDQRTYATLDMLCTTRWTVRTTCCNKLIILYHMPMNYGIYVSVKIYNAMKSPVFLDAKHKWRCSTFSLV